VQTIYIHALSENTAMLKLAKSAGAIVERDGSESEAWLKLPPDSLVSHLDEMIGEQAAEFDYGLKLRTRRREAGANAAQADVGGEASATTEAASEHVDVRAAAGP
jgi:hypothetical protein